jgi:hypothetical protein
VLPLGIRADALLLGNKVDTDNLSYNVNAVATLRCRSCSRMRLRPEGTMAPGGAKENGWNYGAGVALPRRWAFVEMPYTNH